MSDTNYFWQGGQKIEIAEDRQAITMHAPDTGAAEDAADRAGVELRSLTEAGPGLVRAEVVGESDQAVERLRDDSVVHRVYRNAADPSDEILITESFFIKFKEGTPADRIARYFEEERLVVEQDLGARTFLVRVTSGTGRNPIRTANAAAARDDVEYAEPNLVRQLVRFSLIPGDELFPDQWHLHAPSNAPPDLVAGAGIFAADAWELTIGSREIVVAVADDGFDLTHPDFQGADKVAGQFDAQIVGSGSGATITWGSDVSPRPGDYHGTPCLGVAVAEMNGHGTVGVAPGCALLAVRFPLSMSDANFVTMFRKISSLADVVSCSWGYGPTQAPMSTALRDAITDLAATGGRRGRGLIICIAAGNNNCPVKDLQNTRTYRFRDQFGQIKSYSGPIDRWIAAHPDVITVSASTSKKTRAAYSSWGPEINVCAPSNNFDDLGNVATTGLGITTTDNEGFGARSDFTAGSRFTSRFGGTSSATPTVAGICGLILSRNPSLSMPDVRRILEETADRDLVISSETAVNVAGDFDAQGFSPWFGHGKVNAFEAVMKAAPSTGPAAMIDRTSSPGLEIPDAGQPITDVIEIDDAGTIADLRVGVEITHTYIGDLRVDLIAPDGTTVTLHNQSGGSADNIRKIYGVADVPALNTMIGRSIRGQWTLRVSDRWRLDVGTLDRWRLAAKLSVPAPLGPAVADGAHAAKRGKRKPDEAYAAT